MNTAPPIYDTPPDENYIQRLSEELARYGYWVVPKDRLRTVQASRVWNPHNYSSEVRGVVADNLVRSATEELCSFLHGQDAFDVVRDGKSEFGGKISITCQVVLPRAAIAKEPLPFKVPNKPSMGKGGAS